MALRQVGRHHEGRGLPDGRCPVVVVWQQNNMLRWQPPKQPKNTGLWMFIWFRYKLPSGNLT